MARVRSFGEGCSNSFSHPTEVDCLYQVVVDAHDGRILQLTTYGSDLRKSGPKASQTLQFDVSAAKSLLGLLLMAFPELEAGIGS